MPKSLVPICFSCSRFADVAPGVGLVCEAFHDKAIPVDILASRADHHKPYVGDHGLQYLPRGPKENERDDTQGTQGLPSSSLDAEWEERKHPRGEGGKFSSGGSSIIASNQTVSPGVYGMSVRNEANVPEAFIKANQHRIDRAYRMGEPIWMIAEELKMIHGLGPKPKPTPTPRALATRVVKVNGGDVSERAKHVWPTRSREVARPGAQPSELS